MRSSRRSSSHAGCVVLATLLTLPPRAAADEPAPPPIEAKRKQPPPDAADGKQRGAASYYSKHLRGRKTASGETYDPNALTAAHRTLPLGTQVKVVNPKNDRSVVVTVNDRGPVPKNRIIDVSNAAADRLGMSKSGVVKVETEVVGSNGSPTK